MCVRERKREREREREKGGGGSETERERQKVSKRVESAWIRVNFAWHLSRADVTQTTRKNKSSRKQCTGITY